MSAPPANTLLSEIFQARLYRDYTNASGEFSGAKTSGVDVDVLFSDMHRRSDTVGNRQEYVK